MTTPGSHGRPGAAARSHEGQRIDVKGPAAGEACAPSPPYDDPEPVAGESAAWVVRTALCVQPREGRLYVFMPPMALEGTWNWWPPSRPPPPKPVPVVIEGYTPPTTRG
jgi:uncharacterized protein (DUF2126 family)